MSAALVLSAALAAASGGRASAQNADVVTLRDIRHEVSEGTTRVVVEADGPLRYDYRSPDASQVRLTLAGADPAGLPERIAIDSSEVREVRIASVVDAGGAAAVRLEVDLQGPMYHQVFTKGQTLVLVFRQPPPSRATPGPETVEPRSPLPPSSPTVPASSPDAELEPGLAAGEAASPAASAGTGDEPESLAEPAAAPAASPATQVLGISVDRNDGSLAVRVKANGRLRHEEFFVEAPDRLVVDFEGAVFEATRARQVVDEGPVRRVRLAQHSLGERPVTRLVIDLTSRVAYEIVEGPQALTVLVDIPAGEPR